MEQKLDPQAQQGAEKHYKENVKAGGETTQDVVAKLVKFGGFKVFGNSIKGTDNLNPELKARKKIFLTDASKKSRKRSVEKNA
jgi:hypothetical protein